MTEETQASQNTQANENSIAVGSLNVAGSVDGSLIIGSHNVIGFTSDQISTLIAQISTTFQPKPFDGRSPYKGLDFFEEEDAELFFGREKLVQDLISRVKDSCTVFITGPSGSGKSSLVRAGLIHALKQGSIPNSEKWLYATIKPGREPIQTLARAVAGLVMSTNAEDEIRTKAPTDETIFARWCEIALRDGHDKRVVLFIDQFEEVFTQISKEEERVAFLNLLTYAAAVENGRVSILFSMRSDFIPNCATYLKLNALLNRQFVQIGAMQGDELVSAIAQPALRVGLRIDPDLIAQIINDMQGEPGALPLMQFALKDLFDAQQTKGGLIALTLNDYLERGGIRKALERHADQTFAGLSTDEQELTRSIFTGLIEIGRGTQDTRRTAIFDELVPANVKSANVEVIVAKLADARLITTDEVGGRDTVTISHEKLIDAWPWLKKLVNENRDVIALQNEIAEDAKEWEEHQRDASYLYSGARLATAQEKMTAQKIVLSGLAKEFIEQGIAVREAERKAKEDLRRRITAGLIAGTAIALLLAGFAVFQMLKAQTQAKIARSGELIVQAQPLIDSNLQLALLLGIEAFHEYDNSRSRKVLLEATFTSPELQQFLTVYEGRVYSVAFSPNGKTLASGSCAKFDSLGKCSQGQIILWDLSTRQRVGPPLTDHSGIVTSLAFSPDGKFLASGSFGNITLWNLATSQPTTLSEKDAGKILSVAFSPNGNRLAAGSTNGFGIWDISVFPPVTRLLQNSSAVHSVAFSLDGMSLAVGSDDGLSIWNLLTHPPQVETLAPDSTMATAFSPDGKFLLAGGENGLSLWDLSTQPFSASRDDTLGSVTSIAFSLDRHTLAIESNNGIQLVEYPTGNSLIDSSLKAHSNRAYFLALSPDGKVVASGSDSGVILWDISDPPPLSQTTKASGHIFSLVFSPDGRTLASGSDDGITTWAVSSHTLSSQKSLSKQQNAMQIVSFSPDGKMLASENQSNIVLWNLSSQPPSSQTINISGKVSSLAFSPDGRMLASGDESGIIEMWNVSTRQKIGQTLKDDPDGVKSLAFSPDEKTLAAGGRNGISLWDLSKQPPTRKTLTAPGKGFTVAFSPDGKILVSVTLNSIILWNASTHQQIAELLSTFGAESVTFSPDGNIFATGGPDGINLWDLSTRQRIGQPLQGHATITVNFSSDGKTLASGSDDGTIMLWDLDPESWVKKSCQRAGRNFTRAEWGRYFPNEEYRKTCEEWPPEPDPVATPQATP